MKARLSNPGERAAQEALAKDITSLVHGDKALAGGVQAAAALFGEISIDTALEEHAPTKKVEERPDTVVAALGQSGLTTSKSEARRLIKQGGCDVKNRPGEER